MVHISFGLASLRVNLIEYSCFPTTCYPQPSTLKGFFSSCQIVSSYSFELLSSILWPAPSSSVVLWGILLILETLFVLWGYHSMGVFQSLTWMVSSLLLHVSCHYSGILQLLATLSSCFVGSWCNIAKTSSSLNCFVLFDRLSEDGMPLTTV